MADKSNQLLLSALSRAVAETVGLPLHPVRGSVGLFPATAAGRQAAQRCLDEDYLQPDAAPATLPLTAGAASAATLPGKTATSRYVVTDKGLSFLLGQTSPRPVLEDFVRVLEAREAQAVELVGTSRKLRDELIAFRARAEQVLQRVCAPAAVRSPGDERRPAEPAAELAGAVLAALTTWQSTSSGAEDCSLPELYRRTADVLPPSSIGRFHDVLRGMHENGVLFLHPWTGPLHELPEPAYALMIGHMIAYYASIRCPVEAQSPRTG